MKLKSAYQSPARWMAALLLAVVLSHPAHAQRQMEKLGRGVVALHSATSQAYVGWRLLATDPTDVGFNVYRSVNGGPGVLLNTLGVITNTTDYIDTGANFTQSNAWYVVPVIGGVEQTPSAPSGLPANAPVRQYVPIPLQPVIGGLSPPYDVKFCWVGDFDGDGEYDFLVDRLTVSATNKLNQYLQAYKRDGTFLWQMDMGFNSTNTANAYEPDASAISVGDKDNVTVYDLDGDGKAEVIVRTANGVVFGDGAVLTAPNNTVQYLSVIDGMTGHEVARATMPNPYFSDGPLNSHFGILYCDGVHPSILVDGENRVGSAAFQRIAVAWDYRDGQLVQRWQHIAGPGENDSRAHQIRIADVNHDGKDDVVEIGSVLSGPDGALLYQTELQHGDRYHVTDIDPDRPGLEMFAIQQLNSTLLATTLQDMGSGVLFKKWYSSAITDVGRGITLDMDPGHRGCELYSTQPGIFDAKGAQIFANNIWAPEGVWWDADLTREFEDGAGSGALSPVVNKFNPATGVSDRIYTIYNEDGGVHQAFGGRAAFWGDILGDWREEFILVANDFSQIRIYTTKIAATNRLYCLMQNPQYRVQCTYKGYYQASYVDYFLGYQMPPPPPPPISDARLVWRGDGTNVWDEGLTANWFTNALWISNDTAVVCAPGDTVLFDLTGSNNTAITLVGSLTPGDVRVHSPKDYTFAGDGELSGAMSLTKAGAGRLTFSGTNTYTGTTLIAEGPFVVNGSLPSSPVTVRGGVWLDGRLGGNGVVGSPVSIQEGAGVSPGAGTNSPGTLTIANNLTLTGRTLNDFDLSDDPTGAVKSNDLVVITGNLAFQGTNTIVVHQLDATLPPGSLYPLFNYSGSFSGNLNNLKVAGLDGVPLALTNPPGQIALVIRNTRGPTTLTWTGGKAGNFWDLATSSNFLNGAAKDWFVPRDFVRFDNIGASNLTVTLTGTLLASNVVVDSSSNYTWTGSGALSGSASLTKSNSGTLTLSTLNNSFTGRSIIAGGMVVVSELDAVGYPSPLGNPGGNPSNLVFSGSSTLRVTGESYTDRGMTLNSGTNTLDIFNGSDQVTIAGQIVGAGALQKLGAGTLALTVANTYSGGTLVKAGSIALGSVAGNQSGVGTGTVTLDNGTLSMINIQASETAPWSLNVPTTGRLDCDGRCTLTGSLTGAGTFNVWTPYVRTDFNGNWSAFSGQINVITDTDGGDFRCNNSAGYPNAKINLAALTSLQNRVGGTPTIPVGEISGAAGSFISAPGGNGGIAVNWRVGGLNTSTTFAGVIANSVGIVKVGTGTWTLTGTNTYSSQTTLSNGVLQIGSGGTLGTLGSGAVANYASLVFNRSDAINDSGFGVIGGSGVVIKRGAGVLSLAKSHTFTGMLSLETGTLALTNSGSIAGSTNIHVASGTLFNLSGRTDGGLALAAGQMLSGNGSVAGGFTLGSGARLSPGSNAIGRLTFSNAVTLATGAISFLEISKSPFTNDVVRVLGALTNGGTLVVTQINTGVLAANDSFKLFNAAAYSGVFDGTALPPLNAGLAWDTSQLKSSGTLKVAVKTAPWIQTVRVDGLNLVLSGSNGVPDLPFYLLASTNLALPIVQWTRSATNRFDDSGRFTCTNALDPALPQNFYLLQVP